MYTRTYRPSEVIEALNVYNTVHSFRVASKIVGISKSTIQRWWGSLRVVFKRQDRRKKRKKRASIFPNLPLRITSMFASSSSLRFRTLKEIQGVLHKDYPEDKAPSISWIHRLLHTCRVSRRRFSISKIASNDQLRMDLLNKAFDQAMSVLKDNEIVCIDETHLCNIGNPIYGYFPKGQVPTQVSFPKRLGVSIIVGIHPSGVVAIHKQAKAFNKEAFLHFLENDLLPSLPSSTKAILMDNVAFHKSKEVRDLLESKNLMPLFIPPYSPRCNPIEEVFAWMKRHFRNLDQALPFDHRVEESIRVLNLYKDIVPYYKHTRDHVLKLCPRSGL